MTAVNFQGKTEGGLATNSKHYILMKKPLVCIISLHGGAGGWGRAGGRDQLQSLAKLACKQVSIVAVCTSATEPSNVLYLCMQVRRVADAAAAADDDNDVVRVYYTVVYFIQRNCTRLQRMKITALSKYFISTMTSG